MNSENETQSVPLEVMRITRREWLLSVAIQGEYQTIQYKDGWSKLSWEEKIPLMAKNAMQMADLLCAHLGKDPDEVLSFQSVTNITKMSLK